MATYPQVKLRLSGEDGNGFIIASRMRKAMERAGLRDEGKAAFDEALAQPSYDDLLQFVMRTVETT